MYGIEAKKAIEAEAWGVMHERGPGTVSKTSVKLGKPKRGLENARGRKEGLRVKEVTGILDVLGIPASVFFDKVFGGSAATAADHFMARGARLAARQLVELPELAAVTKPDRLTEDDLARLDAARFEDPRAAAEQAAGIARQAARDGRRGDLAAAVARQGSALRVAEEWEPAWVCVWWALRQEPDRLTRADLQLRSAAILSDYGEHQGAAAVALEVATEYLLLKSDDGIGKALMSRGAYLYFLGEHHEARLSLDTAFRHLGGDKTGFRFWVHQVLGLVLVELGRYNRAAEHATTAETFELEGGRPKAHLVWLRARIAAGREDFPRAVQLYETALLELRDSPGESALAGSELCRVLLRAGLHAQAVTKATSLAALAIPRRQNRIVSAAIRRLYRSALKGRLELRLVERVIEKIRWGLNRRAAPDARPGNQE